MWRLMGETTMFVAIFGSCFEPESHSGQIRMAESGTLGAEESKSRPEL